MKNKDGILYEYEKIYLNNIIKPFRKRVDYVSKRNNHIYQCDFIEIVVCNENNFTEHIELPFFKENTMYENMELNKKYTLEELGL